MEENKINSGNRCLSSGQGNIVIKSEDDIICEKKSPFIVYEYMRYKRVKKRDCSNIEINRLLANGVLTDAHDKVFKILGKFGYLNSFMIRTYLSHITGGQYDFDAVQMRKLLKNMVKLGFLLQYELFHADEEGLQEGELQGSPFIYCLSAGGIKYLKKQGITNNHEALNKPFDVTEVLHILSFNQFHIMFIKQYGRTALVRTLDYYGQIYEYIKVSGMYTLRIQKDDVLHLFVQPIRNDRKWSFKFLSTLRNIKLYTDKNKINCFIVLFICETEYQAMECAKKQNCDADIKDIEVFFETDTSLITEKDVFDRLISVQPQNDYSCRNIVKLNLRKA